MMWHLFEGKKSLKIYQYTNQKILNGTLLHQIDIKTNNDTCSHQSLACCNFPLHHIMLPLEMMTLTWGTYWYFCPNFHDFSIIAELHSVSITITMTIFVQIWMNNAIPSGMKECLMHANDKKTIEAVNILNMNVKHQISDHTNFGLFFTFSSGKKNANVTCVTPCKYSLLNNVV